MKELIDRQAAIRLAEQGQIQGFEWQFKKLCELPSAQPEYEPVTIDDFAKTMSENTIYSFMEWHGEALGLMERQGFVICKKTM